MSRNIKVKFLSKAPAGFESGEIDFCSEFELKQWQDSGEYKIAKELFDRVELIYGELGYQEINK